MALARGTRLADMEPGRKRDCQERAAKLTDSVLLTARFSDLKSELIQAALSNLREFGKSGQTANHYRAALRAFCRWAVARGRTRDNPMSAVDGFAEEDPEHPRRSLTDDELARLIRYAESGPDRFDMPGPLRAMAYRVAAATGFRVDELRSLTPESFRLDGHEPSLFLRRSSTKNRKPADQPISQSLARDVSEWLKRKPPGQSVFPLHHETAKAIKADLEAIGVPYETDEGTADFHSLRAYYVSALIRSGANVAEFKRLARHAKAETTLKHYAKIAPHNLRGVVESMPDATSATPPLETERMIATGTHPSHEKPFAPILIRSGHGSMRTGAAQDVIGESDVQEGIEGESLQNKAQGGSVRVHSVSGAERGGFEPPRPLAEPNGLANRRYRPLSHLSWRR